MAIPPLVVVIQFLVMVRRLFDVLLNGGERQPKLLHLFDRLLRTGLFRSGRRVLGQVDDVDVALARF